jgi:hypothetical protein
MMGLVSPTMAEDFVLRFGPNTVRIGPDGISVQAPQWALQVRRSQGQDYPVYQARSLPPPPVPLKSNPFWSPSPVAGVPPPIPPKSPPPVAAVPPPPPPKSPPPVATVPPKSPPEEPPPLSQVDPPAPLPEPGHVPPTSKYFGPQSKEKSRPYIQQ